jgi:hypothetical protein
MTLNWAAASSAASIRIDYFFANSPFRLETEVWLLLYRYHIASLDGWRIMALEKIISWGRYRSSRYIL